MSRNATVYSSRARSTGALCETIDTKHAEASKVDLFRKRTKAEEGLRYAARCVDHKQVTFFDEHYPAGRAIAWPQEWCTKCKVLFEKGDRITKSGSTNATVAPKATNGKAPVKATSKAQANKATQKKAAASRKPSEVKVLVPAVESEGDGSIQDAVRAAAEQINSARVDA
jgi:hypothetical protein